MKKVLVYGSLAFAAAIFLSLMAVRGLCIGAVRRVGSAGRRAFG